MLSVPFSASRLLTVLLDPGAAVPLPKSERSTCRLGEALSLCAPRPACRVDEHEQMAEPGTCLCSPFRQVTFDQCQH